MRFRVLLLILCLVTCITYISSMFNPFIWDDEQFIYKNVHVLTFNLPAIITKNTIDGAGDISNYYRPLTTLSFAFDHAIWGLQPFGFHFTNIILHIATAVLVAVVLYVLTKRKVMSFLIALIFAVHPLQTEAVTYINSRGDSLSAFFGLLSALCFWLYIHKKKYSYMLYNIKVTIHTFWFCAASSIFYICSIFSKEIGIVTLALLVCIALKTIFDDVFTMKKMTIKKILTQNKASSLLLCFLICVAIGYLILRDTILNFNNSFDFYSDHSLYSESMLVRLATFSRVLWTYWSLMLVSYPLHMERSQNIITSIFSFWPIVTTATIVVLLCLALYRLLYKKSTNAMIGMVWFFALLIPVSGIVPINGILYEHWLYLPLVGFFLFIADVLSFLPPRILAWLALAMCTIFSILTIRQNYIWGDEIRFYEYTLTHAQTQRLYNNLGMSYAARAKYDKALAAYTKALSFGLDHPSLYHNIGNTYVALEQSDQAIYYYEKALTIQPTFFHSYIPLISLYVKEKKIDMARKISAQAHQYFTDTYFLTQIDRQIQDTEQ